ncbi:TAXI family TRAP transporter solute-binding subunit [Pseudonocardia acidicola]|uniref:TAXI family TRAP transporter solute-binding subunit n=1 Tax=Pseudonocardia acidicola TaxID=2724939 RepID=A0ABX1S2S9_9PSEU|nr:TAXI family TRAP transporter solute-binding subunit [Pseudonocardia acidicola]NMH95860.1 TAXI family TRAP transporter solute-binding subunit [Pseudonocardia acidicola]
MGAPDRATLNRRQALRALGVAGLAAGLTGPLAGCSSPFTDLRLTIATGGTQGVYYALGGALADAWQQHLGLAARPAVLATAGSVQNLTLLSSGQADVVFSQVDTGADLLEATPQGDPRSPRALARIYDDVVHVVVRGSSRFQRLADLRGARVSVGAPNSGVTVIAQRLLTVAGLVTGRDLQPAQLGINESVAAMQAGTIDAFFWSGGLPTAGVSELAATMPIRLLDLSDVLKPMRAEFPVYSSGTVPAASYGIPNPISTLLVRNFLLVRAAMSDDLADALVAALFAEQPRLAAASAAALTIDSRAAIGTQPIPLHPGAERFYRSTKAL